MAIYLQALAAVAGVYILSSIYNLYKNLQWAKKHNIPYLISPYSQSTIIAGFISGAYCKVASKLGLKGRWVDWARMGSFNAPWKYKRALYAEYGDIIFDVSPGKAVLRIGDADVAWEMMQRRQDFPKPTESYERLNLYGDNVLGTEGREWRIHRKITSPPFSERNNKAVWEESIRQAEECIRAWTHPNLARRLSDSEKPIQVSENLRDEYMLVSLYVISCAGFGMRLDWPVPGQKEEDFPKAKGHKMTFHHALTSVVDHTVALMLFPKWLLRWSPLTIHKNAILSYNEFYQYMEEMYEDKKKAIEQTGYTETGGKPDLMESMIRATKEAQMEKTEIKEFLTKEEILGNTFLFILAGHETTANTMHYLTIFLALHPEIQKLAQAELDAFFPAGTMPTYEHDYEVLGNGWLLALMYETLRLYPPVTGNPISCKTPQTVTYQGRQILIPSPNYMELSAASVHRHPKYWREQGRPAYDAHVFRPERWFAKPEYASISREEAARLGPERIMKPHKGSFFPFREGARGCLGRKFATVEVMAVMMRLLREYSFELAVDTTKGETWEEKAEEAREVMARCLIGVSLRTLKDVPIAFVRRGEERWMDKSGEGTYVPLLYPDGTGANTLD